jgi:hypothetical protein
VCGRIPGEVGYVLLLPLSALVFLAVGRHPLASSIVGRGFGRRDFGPAAPVSSAQDHARVRRRVPRRRLTHLSFLPYLIAPSNMAVRSRALT